MPDKNETRSDDMRRRIEKLEARAEIAELVSAYALACDEHDLPRLESLFTPDAEFSSKNGSMAAIGRPAIVKMYEGVFKTRGPGYHWTHDHFVTFDETAPDTATGMVLGHAETTPDDQACIAAMRYEDVYRRIDGGWLFRKRVLSFFYYMPVVDYPEMLAGRMRIRIQGQVKPADYPESLPIWQAFERSGVAE